MLRPQTYTPRGRAGYWLTSEAFDLLTDQGSVEAEQATLRALELLRAANPQLADVQAAHGKLRAVLPDVDIFWVRWNAFVERDGGGASPVSSRRRSPPASTNVYGNVVRGQLRNR